jgi:hypothetical protein
MSAPYLRLVAAFLGDLLTGAVGLSMIMAALFGEVKLGSLSEGPAAVVVAAIGALIVWRSCWTRGAA